MKSCTMFFISLALITPSLFSGDVDLSGYFESQWMGAQTDAFIQLQSNKLRVDLQGNWNQLKFGANINWITYHGTTQWTIPDYLPEKISDEIPDILRPYYVLNFSDEHKLDNAFVQMPLNKLDLTIGRQQISFGSGYAWNPTDLFNTKDLFDPTYEQPGHNAIRADIYLANRLNMTVLYSPESDWNQSSKLMNMKIGLGRFDLSLIAVEKGWAFNDYKSIAGLQSLNQMEKRQMLGGSLVGEILGLGVWAEGGYNRMESQKDFYEIATGFNHTFDFQTFVIAEYFYNGLGKLNSGGYTLNDWMRYFNAEQKSLNRHQLYCLIQHPISDLTQIGISTIFSGDGSLVLVPTLTSSPFENIEILAYANLFIGSDTSVFNKNLGNGGLIRVKVYF